MRTLLLILLMPFVASAQDTLYVQFNQSSQKIPCTIQNYTNGVFKIKVNKMDLQYEADKVSYIYVSDSNKRKDAITQDWGSYKSSIAAKTATMFKNEKTGQIMMADTVALDNVKASDIFKKAKNFLLTTPYIKNKYVVSADSTDKQIILTGKNDLTDKANPLINHAKVAYTVDFKCKDGKYRIVITYQTFDGQSSDVIMQTSQSVNFETSTNYKKYKPGDVITYDPKSPVAKFALSIINGLKDSFTNTDEEW
ncbi:MAG: DUF4468 domain-containing protein [Sphingobacteriales bacterium JAD_PAG50586_3]|nr:MAG: DUF4468 domain-containing protein [Sphingobacteriales bacterium JAD_PAG50586_3]